MQLTLQQAANATGKAKSTIQRAIKSGRLSATRGYDGSYLIDVAELSRVYVLRNAVGNVQQAEQLATAERNSETAVLQAKNELLSIQLERERDSVNDLRERLDRAEAERRQLTLMLTHQPEAKPSEPVQVESKLLQKLFGRKY